MGAWLLLGAIPILLSLGKSGGSRATYPQPKPQSQDVPFAQGTGRPVWPVVTDHPRATDVSYRAMDGEIYGRASRRFRASRDGGERYHAGIDLFAYPLDTVVAMESGEIVALQKFLGDTWAVLVQGDSGLVVLYGEVERNSWRQYGLSVGSRVRQGSPIGSVGVSPRGTSMLHMETYRPGTTRNEPWLQPRIAPPNLLDPTDYLLRATQRRASERSA